MRHFKSHASHRQHHPPSPHEGEKFNAPPVFVARSAVMVFALVAAYPWTTGTPRQLSAYRTPEALPTANNLKTAWAKTNLAEFSACQDPALMQKPGSK